MSHKVAILTVVYRNYTTLKDFFGSLSKQTSKDFQVYLFDSSPQKVQFNVPSYAQLIQGENRGYAHGINTAYSYAEKNHDYFIVVNSDVIFDAHFIENAVQSLTKNPHSLIGGKIYYASGYEYHSTNYSPKDHGKVLWYAGGHIDWHNVVAIHRGVDMVDTGQYDRKEETHFITGCLLCYSKETAKILGTWDTKYGMYFEDADFCVRAKQKNISLMYDPSLIIWHKNAQSSGGSGSHLQEKLVNKSRLLFGLRYASFRTKIHLLKNEALRFLRFV